MLLLGDNQHTPDETNIIPEVVSVDPGSEVMVSVTCNPRLTLYAKEPPLLRCTF